MNATKPPSTWYAKLGLLTRHGIDSAVANPSRKAKEETEYAMLHKISLQLAVITRNDEMPLSIPVTISACFRRNFGMDVDYARAFFPGWSLKCERVTARDQGIQTIYLS